MENIYVTNYIKEKDYKEGDNITNGNIEYKLDKLLGIGQFGIAFKCKTSVGRNIAIKIINKEKLIEKGNNNLIIKANKDLELIQNEINIHQNLSNENILNFGKMFQDNSYIYMILELCTLSLYDVIYIDKEYISEKDIIRIICKIVNGLMYLKENLIIHRDIKAENILINDDGNIKIADFGFAVKLNDIYETKTRKCGSLDYLSFQIVSNLEYSFETDVWSLGVLFYELLFKTTPFMEKSQFNTIRSIKTKDPIYPEDSNFKLNNIIDNMFIKNRLKRISLEKIIIELGCK